MFGGRRAGRRREPPRISDDPVAGDEEEPETLEEEADRTKEEATASRQNAPRFGAIKARLRAPFRNEPQLAAGQAERRRGMVLRSLLAVPMAATIGLLTDEQWDRVEESLPLLHDKKEWRTKQLRKACFNRGEITKGKRQMLIDRLHYSISRQRRRQDALDQERYDKWLYDSQAEGTVFAFGKNDRGQLGLGTQEPTGEPSAIQPLTGKQITSVHAGFDSDVVFAVSAPRDEVYAWGRLSGPTGLPDAPARDGDIDESLSVILEDKREPRSTWEQRRELLLRPVLLRRLCGEAVIDVSVGRTHCLAQTAGGDLFGWGVDTHRQTGLELPRQAAANLRKERPDFAYISQPTMLSDRRVPLEQRVQCVAAGVAASVAVTEDGTYYEFSKATEDEGEGVNAPLTVRSVLDGHRVTRVACGTLHVAVLTRDGDVYTWGCGDGGRLGHGDTRDRQSPARVEALAEHAVQDVQCSAFFSGAVVCVPPLMSGGWVFTWGTGMHGQLGQGRRKVSLVPEVVEELARQHAVVQQLSLGMYHCAALTIEREVFTWGSNHAGCLGRANTLGKLGFTPVPGHVEGLHTGKKGDCVQVACGRDFTLVVTAPYTGKSDEELLAEYYERQDEQEAFGRVREREDAKERARAEAAAEKDRKRRLHAIVVRFPGCAQCAFDLACPGFQPSNLQPFICKHCQHEKHRHTLEHSASDPRMTIEAIEEMERKLGWRAGGGRGGGGAGAGGSVVSGSGVLGEQAGSSAETGSNVGSTVSGAMTFVQ